MAPIKTLCRAARFYGNMIEKAWTCAYALEGGHRLCSAPCATRKSDISRECSKRSPDLILMSYGTCSCSGTLGRLIFEVLHATKLLEPEPLEWKVSS